MPAPEFISMVHDNIAGSPQTTPRAFVDQWQPKGWELADPSDAQYLPAPVPEAPVDVITRPELDTALAGLSATYVGVDEDGNLVLDGGALDYATFSQILDAGATLYRGAPPKVSELTPPVVIAHRGGGALTAPDGTLESMRFAATLGLQAIDAGDFRTTLDGAVVSMHDATLDRTTTLTGNVSDFTAAALANGVIDASSWFGGGWSDSKIPTAGQIFNEFGGQTVLMPEPKDDGAATRIAALIARRKLGGSVLVNAFDLPKVTPSVAVGAEGMLLVPDGVVTPSTLLSQGVNHVGVDHSVVSLAQIDTLIAAGLKVWVYTLVRQADFDRYNGRNVFGFWIDEPLYCPRNYGAYRKLTAPWVKNATFYHGHIPATGSPDANRGTFVGTPGAYRWKQSLDGYVLQGWGSPVPNAASSYSITVPITFDTAPSDTSRWKGIFVCSPTDVAYTDSGLATENGYNILLRANGTLGIFKRLNGANTAGPSVSTAAIGAGGTATVRIDVTPTTVTATRTDVSAPNSVALADSANRGGYFFIGQNGIASGLTTSVGAVTVS